MSKSIQLKVDIRQVEGFADRLGRLSGRELGEAAVDALNEVVERAYEFGRDRMTQGINLSDEYVRERMQVDKATQGRPEATITAFGSRPNLTILGRYDAQARPVPVTSGRRSRSTGALRSVIPAGQKQSGVTVGVSKGSRSFVERGFLLPLRRGTEAGGNGLGVFARNRAGKLLHRYGPSVYQLFGFQIQTVSFAAEEDLAETLLDKADAAVEKALT